MSALELEFARVLDGETTPEETKDFLRRSVESMRDPDAIVAGARAMRARMVRVEAPAGAIDVCGTGGDGAHTLNISTAVALVVAGCGVPVAKHGNRAMSSKCGAADVLEALGVKLTGDAPTLERALREANVAFLFAQNHHPAMRHVAAARRELGHRTIFNLLGPLSNPASVKRQLVGVFDPALMRPIAEALRLLGAERAMVLHGAGGLDELSFAPEGQSRSVILDQDNSVQEVSMDQRQDSQMYEVPLTPISALAGGSAHANAAALRALLESRAPNSAYESAVLLNAVQALCLADKAETGWDAWDLAKRSIRDGRALAALERLVEITQAAP